MKILHMADCHLDTPFRSLPPKAAALRRRRCGTGFAARWNAARAKAWTQC